MSESPLKRDLIERLGLLNKTDPQVAAVINVVSNILNDLDARLIEIERKQDRDR